MKNGGKSYFLLRIHKLTNPHLSIFEISIYGPQPIKKFRIPVVVFVSRGNGRILFEGDETKRISEGEFVEVPANKKYRWEPEENVLSLTVTRPRHKK